MAPSVASQERSSRVAASLAGAAIAALIVALAAVVSGRQAVLFAIGAAAGVVLYHAAFGFAGAWRAFVADGRGAGLRAQMIMLALATTVFVPVIAARVSVFGVAPSGASAPLGVALVLGAFLFGVGMQLGGGCASGTLYTVGGGSVRMLITLAAFIVGSFVATAHAPFWSGTPAAKAITLVTSWGAVPTLLFSWSLFAGIALLTSFVERRRFGALEPAPAPPRRGMARVLRGPWPIAWGAVGLALVNVLTLLVAGRPWGVTSAFALWGAKLAQAAGVDVASWPYWASRKQALDGSVLADVTSVMDIGIVLGALLASGLAGRFAPVARVPSRSAAAAVVGGLFLGYGARLASGCNIGAYFSGIASSSLHGWVWLVAAFAGTMLGTALRPVFALSVRPDRSAR